MRRNRTPFLVASLLVVAAVVYLMISSTSLTAQYFLTVAELHELVDEVAGRSLTVSGAVLGDTIVYDAMAPRVTFSVAHVPGDPKAIEAAGGLARVLHDATLDPTLPRLEVVYEGVKPDLLQNEAQAIMRGRLGADGRFVADDLLLKCPSRYDEEIPAQAGE
jgi:cytochrome c-type biogenesis protein CcmE